VYTVQLPGMHRRALHVPQGKMCRIPDMCANAGMENIAGGCVGVLPMPAWSSMWAGHS